MKRNLIKGIILIGAVALSSCSVNKLASNKNDDDVYFSKATAAEQPEYIARQEAYRQDVQEDNNTNDDDDYYYYDDYASRINRFSYYSPFGYNYDYGFSPYGYGYGSGFGLGLGFGYGGYGGGYYGYSPFGYGYGLGLGYGYGGFGYGGYYGYGYGGYNPYNYYGIGYGGGGYWGPVSANNTYGPRPNRGNGTGSSTIGVPRSSFGGSGRAVGVGNQVYYSGRPARVGAGSPSYNGRGNSYGTSNGARPARAVRDNSPQYNQPRPISVERPAPSYSPSPSSGGGGGSSSGGGGGGGGRPVRP
ncbi:hypothetical protein [Mucilaginibacter sp.]|uniref:hypothetical protein n=1 Tax=Mucilaginibacter sp. TaxID=1882438 RepID=UPI0035BBF2BB